jgi:hypothetical protein
MYRCLSTKFSTLIHSLRLLVFKLPRAFFRGTSDNHGASDPLWIFLTMYRFLGSPTTPETVMITPHGHKSATPTPSSCSLLMSRFTFFFKVHILYILLWTSALPTLSSAKFCQHFFAEFCHLPVLPNRLAELVSSAATTLRAPSLLGASRAQARTVYFRYLPTAIPRLDVPFLMHNWRPRYHMELG